jgi:hypothetical protein
MAVTVTGATGALHWGYHVAGTLRAWAITKTDEGLVLTAQIQDLNAFRIKQRPLVFVVAHTHGVWRWPITAAQMADTTLTASLGPRGT